MKSDRSTRWCTSQGFLLGEMQEGGKEGGKTVSENLVRCTQEEFLTRRFSTQSKTPAYFCTCLVGTFLIFFPLLICLVASLERKSTTLKKARKEERKQERKKERKEVKEGRKERKGKKTDNVSVFNGIKCSNLKD